MKDGKIYKILEAATDILLEKGTIALTMREIARKADVSLGVINYYFATKGMLYKKLISYICDKLIGLIVFTANPAQPLYDNLLTLLNKINELFKQHHKYVRAFLLLKVHAQIYLTYQPYFEDVEKRAEECLSDISKLDERYNAKTLKYFLWSNVYYSFLILNQEIPICYLDYFMKEGQEQ